MAKITYSQDLASAKFALVRFGQLIGPSDLSEKLKRLRKKLTGRMVLSDNAAVRYAVPMGLVRLYGRQVSSPKPISLSKDPSAYHALAFATTAVEVSRHLSSPARKILVGRLRAALSPAQDARPLAHEFRVVTTLAQKGWDVEFTDFEQRAPYDFIARKDATELEVECKAITANLGSAVHLEDLDNFGEEALRRIERLMRDTMFVRIDVSLAGRLPKDANRRTELVDAIASVLMSKASRATVDETNITVEWLEASPLDMSDIYGSAEREIRKIKAEKSGSCVCTFSRRHFIVVHVYSERDSRIGKELEEVVKEGAGQLSGERPGIVWTHFVDITSDGLNSIMAESLGGTHTTVFERIALEMFNAEKYGHVAALLFSGEPPIQRLGGPGSLIICPPYFSQMGTLRPLWNRYCRHNQPFKPLL